ncbi:MAG: attachment protein [Rhodospirillales bacterium 20-64-7]|nr:MAG: attachment protein [Rhodospirillales bacterium 20-64-7]
MAQEIPHDAMIALVDGGKALLLRNIGTETSLSLREEGHLTLQDVTNDGPSGTRPVEQTPHQTDEATFAKQLIKRLTAMHEAGDFAAIVLAADPQTLGQLRAAMHKDLERAVLFTLAKDFTNMKLPDIAHALAKHSTAN